MGEYFRVVRVHVLFFPLFLSFAGCTLLLSLLTLLLRVLHRRIGAQGKPV